MGNNKRSVSQHGAETEVAVEPPKKRGRRSKIEINKINQVESQHHLEEQVTYTIDMTGKATEEPRIKRRYVSIKETGCC